MTFDEWWKENELPHAADYIKRSRNEIARDAWNAASLEIGRETIVPSNATKKLKAALDNTRSKIIKEAI